MSVMKWLTTGFVGLVVAGLAALIVGLAIARFDGVGSLGGSVLALVVLAISCLFVIAPSRFLSGTAILTCAGCQAIAVGWFARSYLSDAVEGDGLAIASLYLLLPLALGAVASAAVTLHVLMNSRARPVSRQ